MASKIILAACFITDLGTVVALGLIFAPFTIKTLIFLAAGMVVFAVLPWLTPWFFKLYGNRPSELETKFLLFCLLGMGALAVNCVLRRRPSVQRIAHSCQTSCNSRTDSTNRPF
jgi:Kef-type K+ transport system membrane component KefB